VNTTAALSQSKQILSDQCETSKGQRFFLTGFCHGIGDSTPRAYRVLFEKSERILDTVADFR